jgi:hypothetical protein
MMEATPVGTTAAAGATIAPFARVRDRGAAHRGRGLGATRCRGAPDQDRWTSASAAQTLASRDVQKARQRSTVLGDLRFWCARPMTALPRSF